MATTITKFDQCNKILVDGTVDWDTDTIKLALVTSGYTPSGAHTQWADASANETSGTNYTAGGNTLANCTVTTTEIDADDGYWAALTATFRYGIIYANVTRNGLTDPVIAYILFDDTPADVGVTATDFTAQWDATGIITLT